MLINKSIKSTNSKAWSFFPCICSFWIDLLVLELNTLWTLVDTTYGINLWFLNFLSDFFWFLKLVVLILYLFYISSALINYRNMVRRLFGKII